jgi:SAM-dependent methyltransferase
MASSTVEQEHFRAHYEIEKKLAKRLKDAPGDARRTLYSEVYDEMYRSVPQHEGNLKKQSAEMTDAAVQSQFRFIKPYVNEQTVFVEVGAGDCGFAKAVSPYVSRTYAIEVSAAIASSETTPPNMEILITDGISIPIPAETVDLCFSNQVMEHLHPDDALEQLRNIHRALAPGGRYVCLTPNRLNGPHDVSAHFDTEATCFHLREYSITELARVMRAAGFKHIDMMLSIKVRVIVLPAALIWPFEAVLGRLPHQWRKAAGRRRIVEQLLGIRLVGQK